MSTKRAQGSWELEKVLKPSSDKAAPGAAPTLTAPYPMWNSSDSVSGHFRPRSQLG